MFLEIRVFREYRVCLPLQFYVGLAFYEIALPKNIIFIIFTLFYLFDIALVLLENFLWITAYLFLSVQILCCVYASYKSYMDVRLYPFLSMEPTSVGVKHAHLFLFLILSECGANLCGVTYPVLKHAHIKSFIVSFILFFFLLFFQNIMCIIVFFPCYL